MKKAKRWLALILAVTLVSSNALYQIGTTLSADETQSEAAADDSEETEEVELQDVEDTEAASVEEVAEAPAEETPAEEAPEEVTAPAEEEPKEEVAEAPAEETPAEEVTSAEEPKEETAEEIPAETPADETEQDEKAEEPAAAEDTSESEEKTEEVTIPSEEKAENTDEVTVPEETVIVPEETKEEADEEVAYPAFDYKGSKAGVTANISAPEGVFPEGTTVELKALSEDDKAAIAEAAGCETSDVLGLDITFKYEEKEIQPDGNVKVSFSADEINEADSASVYHVNDNGSVDNVGSSKDGDSVGFTADSFSPYGVVLQSNDDSDNISTMALSGGNTVKEGEYLTLTGSRHSCGGYYYNRYWGPYYHSEGWSSFNSAVATVTDGVVRGISAGTVTITHTYCTNGKNAKHQQTETITITVTAKTLAASVSLIGADTVTAYDTIQLTPVFEPTGASATLTWESSNPGILTVDSNGKVTGVTAGIATVTVRAQGANGQTISARKQITVTAATESTDDALFYFLVSPTKDPDSNESSQWGASVGTGKVNTNNATWTNNKNITSNVTGRVISWPTGYENGIVPRTSSAWQTIFDNYKDEVQKTTSYTLTEDDVISIVMIPHKISRNNGTSPDKHVDCRVQVNVKGIHTVLYLVQDVNDSGYNQKGSDIVKDGETTEPADVNLNYPLTKVVNGVTYTFSGWYTNENLTGTEVTFPYTVTDNVTFYAKYTAGHYVRYNLNGGNWTDSATSSSYFKNEGDSVYVVDDEPTKDGYIFLGWKSSETAEDADLLNKDSAPFTMPNHDVTLTAQWEPNTIEYTVNYYWNGTEQSVADSATVPGKKVGDSVTEGPITIEGYTVVNGETQTISLGTDAAQNVINFYYYKNVTLTANSDTKIYNGETQFVDGYTCSDEGAVFENISVGAQGIEVGNYPAEFQDGLVGIIDTTDKYIITNVIDGYLDITPITEKLTVTITGNTDQKEYTGAEQAVVGYISDAPANVTVALKDGKTARTAGTNAGHYTMDLTEDDFVVSSANYSNIEVIVVDGYLDITPVEAETEVVINGHKDTKTYNGTEQSVEGYDVVKADATISVVLNEGSEAKASGTDVGEYWMGLSETDFTVSSENYSNIKVTVHDGKLKIIPADEIVVHVTGNNGSKVYNGNEQSVEGFTSDAPSDVRVTLKENKEAKASGTVVGHYLMGLSADDFTATSANYSKITVVVDQDGYLDITPITDKLTVTITGNHGSKVYNGSEQYIDGYTSDAPANVNVELATGAEAKASGKDAGHYTMDLSEADFVVTSENYSNIEVIVVDGYLDITPITAETEVTITGHHDEKVYNGNVQSVSGYDVTKPDDSVEVTLKTGSKAEASGTVVGHYSMNLSANDFTATSKNYTNLKVTVIDGYLDITPITEKLTVTITGNTDQKEYTGAEQAVVGYISDAPANVTVALKDGKTARTAGTNAGHYTMDLTEDDFVVSSANYSNIEVIVVDGYLDITPVEAETEVVINGHKDTKTYNGTEQSVEGYDVVKADATISVVLNEGSEAKASGTDVGEYWMGLSETDFTVSSENYSNIKVTVHDGKLKIIPADEIVVHVTGNNGSKVYNGNEQSVEGFTSDAPSDVRVTLKENKEAKASGTVVGHYLMGLSADDFTATSANYSKITVVVDQDGYLDITPITDKLTVTITGNHGSKVYNGSEQYIDGYTSDAPANVNVELATGAEAKASGKDAGHYTMGLSEADFVVTSENYSEIEVIVVDGYLDITPITAETEVIINGHKDTKTYNGTAQNVEGYDVVQKADDTINVVLNEGSEAKATGINVGKYPMGLTKDDFTVTSINYSNIKVTVNDGQLTIIPADTFAIHVVHRFAPGNEGDVTLPADYTIENVKANTSRLIEAEAVEGYVAQPIGQTVQVVDQDITVTILYYKDTIGTDPTNPDKPDGIPDDYQVIVRFEAENGIVNFDHTVVTLYDANGNPAANGVGHMSPFRIATARANAGYDQASLSWTPGVPTPEYEITEAMTFRAVFTAATTPTPGRTDDDNPSNPDNNPSDNGGGQTPSGNTTPQTTPAANTPAVANTTPAAVNPVTEFIDNVVTPVVDTIRDRVADIQEILDSDDDQVPLADQKLDDHKCCILHFLIMLLALIIGIFETRSMKKRQKKLQEVREELDCELARRGLPVTSEQQ